MPPTAIQVAARLAGELPAMGLGRRGCLMPDALDEASLAFLDLIDGTADPSLAWVREGSGTGLLVLVWTPLGTEVAAGDPVRLMEALEYLADRADALLPAAQAVVDRTADPDDRDALRRVLGASLRQDLSAALGRRPPGCRFRSAALSTGRPAQAVEPLARPEVQDHRPVIPPRRRA